MSPAPLYHNHGYPTQNTQSGEARRPSSGSLHPAIRPQYGVPQPQEGQPKHHVWQAAPQRPAAAPPQPAQPPTTQVPAQAAQTKQPFTKQSHSPIPLPPYVRQMSTASPSASKASPLSRPPERAGSHPPPPQNPFSATAASPQPYVGVRPAPAPAPNTQPSPNPQNGQWTRPGRDAAGSTTNPQWAPQVGTQQSSNGQPWAPAPQAQPMQPGAGASPTGADSQDNSALLEKMMMNLRRASQNFGRMEDGQSLADGNGQAQAQGQPQS